MPRQASGRPGEVGPSSGVAVASSTAHVAPNATAAKSTATAAPRAVCRRATGRPVPRVAGLNRAQRRDDLVDLMLEVAHRVIRSPTSLGPAVRPCELCPGALELFANGVVRLPGDLGDLVGPEAVQMEEHDHGALLR